VTEKGDVRPVATASSHDEKKHRTWTSNSSHTSRQASITVGVAPQSCPKTLGNTYEKRQETCYMMHNYNARKKAEKKGQGKRVRQPLYSEETKQALFFFLNQIGCEPT
jgi:prolyl-tRNA editing enzyme YbaK/EbsC (Cys-tRNA(Pro) deacylase)